MTGLDGSDVVQCLKEKKILYHGAYRFLRSPQKSVRSDPQEGCCIVSMQYNV